MELVLKNTFMEFCRTIERVKSAFSAADQVKILKEYIASLDDQSLELAIQFLVNGAFSSISNKRIILGSRSISTAASDYCDLDYELVFKPCRKVCTSLSETIAVLIANTAKDEEVEAAITLEEVSDVFHRLEAAGKANDKKQIIKEFWSKLNLDEIFYFNEMVLGKPILSNAEDLAVQAIVDAFGQSRIKIMDSFFKSGNLTETAILAKRDKLSETSIRFFHPVPFMPIIKQRLEDFTNPQKLIAEKLIPGIRCQLHIEDNKIQFISDKKEGIGKSCADLILQFEHKNLPNMILEGTLCYADKNKLISAPEESFMDYLNSNISKLTPHFIAQDIIFSDEEALFEHSLFKRKEKLMKLREEYGFQVSRFYKIEDNQQLEQLYNKNSCKVNGSDWVLKFPDSTYQGHESKNHWLLLKSPAKKLKAIILYAHSKNGWSTDTFTEFTLGISVAGNQHFEEEVIPIGKASANHLKDEWHARIKEHAYDRFGSTLAIKPQFLVDLEYDGIKINKRTKAGCSLKNPVLKNIYPSSHFNELQTLDEILEIHKGEHEINHSTELSDYIYTGE